MQPQAADISGRVRDYGHMMRTQGRKRCVLEHTFFESDLTPLPPPPPLLSQDAGVQECGREVIKGMSSRALGVRPRGKQRYVLARAIVRVLFDL